MFCPPPGGIGFGETPIGSWVFLASGLLLTILLAAYLKIVTTKDPALEQVAARRSRNLALIAILALGFILGFASWITVSRIEAGYKSDIGKSLTTALETSQQATRLLYRNQKAAAKLWAGNREVVNSTKQLLRTSRTAGALIKAPAQAELRSWLKPVFRTVGYRGYFVIGPDRINLSSSRDSNIGVSSLLAKREGFLKKIMSGQTLVSLPQPSDVPLMDVNGKIVEGLATMFVVSPIRDDSGEIIAALAFRIEPDVAFLSVFERGRVGESGETYAFNSRGLMISESIFNEQLAGIGLISKTKHSDLAVELRDPGVNLVAGERPSLPREKQPLTRMALSAVRGESGMDLEGYRDYRGVPVVGAWLWDTELGFALATEIEVSEAFANLRETRIIIVSFSVLSFVLLVVLTIVFTRGQRKLTESEEKYRNSIDSTSEGYWLADTEGVMLEVNRAFSEMLGRDPDELLGKWPFEFVTDECRALHEKMASEILTTKHRNYEITFINKQGGTIDTNISATTIWGPDGKATGAFAFITDISEQKKAKEAAEEANNAKSEFLSSMSHELRTPMNAILGFGQMLDFNPKEPLTEAQKSCVDHIIKGGKHLLELINDVLDLAQIEAGKVGLSIEDISPMGILDECLPLVTTMAERRGIKIFVPDTATAVQPVLADHMRLRQVLLNLISNAVKYNRENGTVSITFEETPNDILRIAVTDTGEGIPENKQSELFKPFSRLGAENSEIEGTGIGLVVCKQLIGLMDGAVGLESEVGRGATFWIDLPMAGHDYDRAKTAIGAAADANEELPGMSGTLLYVEDNPDNLELMELIVARIEGLSMISTHNAELGIELARAENPDVIILDINLPGMSGIEALKKLRLYENTVDIPVLALSAAATKRDIEKGMEAGFQRYLTKPIQIPEVVDAIKSVLES